MFWKSLRKCCIRRDKNDKCISNFSGWFEFLWFYILSYLKHHLRHQTTESFFYDFQQIFKISVQVHVKNLDLVSFPNISVHIKNENISWILSRNLARQENPAIASKKNRKPYLVPCLALVSQEIVAPTFRS